MAHWPWRQVVSEAVLGVGGVADSQDDSGRPDGEPGEAAG
eukprot:SAG25_NODE_5702_length_629_cov_1.056604_1_plen_39_part_10